MKPIGMTAEQIDAKLQEIGRKVDQTPQTFLCRLCQDTGFQCETRNTAHDVGIVFSKFCSCTKGRTLEDGHDRADKRQKALAVKETLKQRRVDDATEKILRKYEEAIGDEEEPPF